MVSSMLAANYAIAKQQGPGSREKSGITQSQSHGWVLVRRTHLQPGTYINYYHFTKTSVGPPTTVSHHVMLCLVALSVSLQ